MLLRNITQKRRRRHLSPTIKIKLTHEGFLAILGQSVKTTYSPDLYPTVDAWKRALDASDVRHQWDPERALEGYPLDRRAIQIGMRGETVRRYVYEWIIELEEVTGLAHSVKAAVDAGDVMPAVPEERVYEVDVGLGRRLGDCRVGLVRWGHETRRE